MVDGTTTVVRILDQLGKLASAPVETYTPHYQAIRPLRGRGVVGSIPDF